MKKGERREKKEKDKISVSSAWHLPEVPWFFSQKKKGQRDPHPSQLTEVRHSLTLSLSLQFLSTRPSTCARFRPEKKKSAVHSPQFLSAQPSTCPRFRPEKKKSATHPPQFPSARPCTCPRFRPEKRKNVVHSPQFLSSPPGTCPRPETKKRKVRSTLHNFCQLGQAPARGSDPKKRKVRSTLSTISVSSARHLPEVQTRKRKSAIHSPQFLSARPSTCPKKK